MDFVMDGLSGKSHMPWLFRTPQSRDLAKLGLTPKPLNRLLQNWAWVISSAM